MHVLDGMVQGMVQGTNIGVKLFTFFPTNLNEIFIKFQFIIFTYHPESGEKQLNICREIIW